MSQQPSKQITAKLQLDLARVHLHQNMGAMSIELKIQQENHLYPTLSGRRSPYQTQQVSSSVPVRFAQML